MRYFVWFLVALLVVLHQDYWQWNDPSLVFGLLPRALAWHVGVSLAAALVWWLAVVYCWPRDVAVESSEGAGKVPPT